MIKIELVQNKKTDITVLTRIIKTYGLKNTLNMILEITEANNHINKDRYPSLIRIILEKGKR